MTARQIESEFLTTVELLRYAAAFNADVEAYVEPATAATRRRTMTFRQWDRAADGVAGLLAAVGVTRGTVVCLVLPSSIDYVVCYAAAARLGAITSGINPRLGSNEIGSILAITRPTVTVLDDDATHPDGPMGTVMSRADVVGAFAGAPPAQWPLLQPTDPVAVVWTSGTTGHPKGAVFDHRSLAAVAASPDSLTKLGDRRLSPLPFAHVGSMTRTWTEVQHGITTVITPSPWTAADAIAVMVDERVTVAQGVPTQWTLVMAHPDLDTADLSSLRIAGTGASLVPAELVAAMRKRLGVPVIIRYSTTEASLGTGTVPGDPDEVVADTVGRAVPGVSLAVVDDDGAELGAFELGRVQLRSAAVMLGYWGGPPTGPGIAGVVFDTEATQMVLNNQGWLTTGDIGFVDDDGYLHLVGRVHDLYIRGGYNVYPAEVESVLAAHPSVAQVAVVGTPDAVLGEIGVAFVVLSHGTAGVALSDLRRWVQESLADYKAPDRMVVLETLPLTSMMKVDKLVLAHPAAEAATGAVAAAVAAELPDIHDSPPGVITTTGRTL